VGVQRGKLGRQLFEHRIDHLPNSAQRVIWRHPLFGRNVAEHGRLLRVVSTHRVVLREGVTYGVGRLYPMNDSWRDQKQSFSAAC
jgi:hypothetical protein